jgi:hypothetical protein
MRIRESWPKRQQKEEWKKDNLKAELRKSQRARKREKTTDYMI